MQLDRLELFVDKLIRDEVEHFVVEHSYNKDLISVFVELTNEKIREYAFLYGKLKYISK